MITDQHEFHLALNRWTDGPKFILAHPESHPDFKEKATDTFPTKGAILLWAEKYPYNHVTVFIDDQELLSQMTLMRPRFDLRLVVFKETPDE